MTRTVVLVGWAVVALLFVSCQVISMVTHRRYAGAQDLMDRLTGGSTPRMVAIFVGWMWVGWHFFAR